MARSNMFLGLASGKVGDVVFARSRGQQIMRVRVVPNNPRTERQQSQRVRLAAVAALYRSAREVLKDSFTIRHGFESSYNAFARNAISLAPFFTKQMVDNCLALPIPAQASRGTLMPLSVDKSSAETGGVDRLPSFGLAADSTLGAWSAAFIANNPTYKNGDKISLVVIRFVENTEVPLADAYNAVTSVHEIVLDTTSNALLVAMEWSFSQGSDGGQYIYPDALGNIFADQSLGADDDPIMSVVIGSSKGANGEMLVSSEYFTLSTSAQNLYDSFRTEAALGAAIASYGSSANSALSI